MARAPSRAMHATAMAGTASDLAACDRRQRRGVFFRPSRFIPLGAALLGLLPSCGMTFRERYHFIASDGEAANYYRVTVSGWTAFTASQYAAGLYDAQAVDQLFGELAGATITISSDGSAAAGAPPAGDAASGAAAPAAPKGESITPVSGGLVDGRKLVLFLSANSDALVGEMSSFVSSRELGTAMTSLMLSPRMQDLEALRQDEAIDGVEAEALADRLRHLADDVPQPPDTMTPAQASTLLASVLQELARSSPAGHAGLVFADVTAATAWLNAHPGAFEQEARP